MELLGANHPGKANHRTATTQPLPDMRPRPATARFDDWFSGSAVVDAGGEALRLFHGTVDEFARFSRTEDIGFHFGSAETANARLLQMASDDDNIGGLPLGANVRPVYLSIRRPLRVRDQHTWAPAGVADMLESFGVITAFQASSTFLIDRRYVRQVMFAAGYDGFVYSNETEGGGDSWIALDAGQIRPAFMRGIF